MCGTVVVSPAASIMQYNALFIMSAQGVTLLMHTIDMNANQQLNWMTGTCLSYRRTELCSHLCKGKVHCTHTHIAGGEIWLSCSWAYSTCYVPLNALSMPLSVQGYKLREYCWSPTMNTLLCCLITNTINLSIFEMLLCIQHTSMI